MEVKIVIDLTEKGRNVVKEVYAGYYTNEEIIKDFCTNEEIDLGKFADTYAIQTLDVNDFLPNK